MTDEEKTEFPRLKDYLAAGMDDLEVCPTEDELSEIAHAAKKDLEWNQNRGIREFRCNDNEREKAFRDHWLKENEPKPFLNSGRGILQDLFINSDSPLHPAMQKRYYEEEIQPRDRKIVATVIQWLGSNVGFSFLQETLKDFGYNIVKK